MSTDIKTVFSEKEQLNKLIELETNAPKLDDETTMAKVFASLKSIILDE
jgi:hypothetical protein